MESLFDKRTYDNIKERVNQLAPESTGQWGKMNVGQMLAHCNVAFKVPLSEKDNAKAIDLVD